MTTKFLENKICTFRIYCRGVSHEKQRFWTIFLSAPEAPPPQSKSFIYNCRLAASESFREIILTVPEGHHPRGTALREALRGHLPLKGVLGGLFGGL